LGLGLGLGLGLSLGLGLGLGWFRVTLSTAFGFECEDDRQTFKNFCGKKKKKKKKKTYFDPVANRAISSDTSAP
jgi:hypothetical protein